MMVAQVLNHQETEITKLMHSLLFRVGELYDEAKAASLEFYQFEEWIRQRILHVLFDRDREFNLAPDKAESDLDK